MSENFPDYPLVIAGASGGMHYDLSAAIKLRKLEKQVLVLGYIEEIDVVPLLSAANVFVYPSLYEGFGFPPLEAMACGTPTIVANTTCLPEVVGDAAMIVDSKDSQELATAIQKLKIDQEHRNLLVEKGKRRASHFTWKKCAESTLDVYKKISKVSKGKA